MHYTKLPTIFFLLDILGKTRSENLKNLSCEELLWSSFVAKSQASKFSKLELYPRNFLENFWIFQNNYNYILWLNIYKDFQMSVFQRRKNKNPRKWISSFSETVTFHYQSTKLFEKKIGYWSKTNFIKSIEAESIKTHSKKSSR